MYATKFAALAFLGTAAAFNPMMQMSTGRRAAIQGAGAAAVAAPLLRPEGAEAATKYPGSMTSPPFGPVITIMDHRGCNRVSKEYTGEKANDMEDEQVVVLKMDKCTVSATEAAEFTSQQLGQFDKISFKGSR
jgi:hypothetical protein